MSVSGVGATTARMILSSLPPVSLQKVILMEDVNTLKSVKGIGLKSAQRILIDLKDKMNIESVTISTDISSPKNIIQQEAMSALDKLGFPFKRTNTIINKIVDENPTSSVEEVIKLALKIL